MKPAMSLRPVAAVILAAGMSRRMGQPKLLLPWRGFGSMLEAVVSVYAGAGIQEILVVTGAEQERMTALLAGLARRFPVHPAYNHDYESGEMLTSLQVGLAGLSPEASAALVGLGDQPQLAPQTVTQILTVYNASSSPLLVPSYKNRRGHPWLVGRELWHELLQLKPPATARDFLQRHEREIAYLQADASVLQDIDTPEQYRQSLAKPS